MPRYKSIGQAVIIENRPGAKWSNSCNRSRASSNYPLCG